MAHGAVGRQETFLFEHDDIHVSVYELFRCLGHAMDLVHPALADHHKRTAFIAASMADEMELPCEDQKNLLLAGLIHDAGAFSLTEKLAVARFDSEAVVPHCTAGYLLLRDYPSLAKIAQIVRHHHVSWKERPMRKSAGDTALKASHLLHLADRVAVSLDDSSEPVSLGKEVVKKIRDESGKMLDPELVRVFEQVASRNAFWFGATSRRLDLDLDRLWRCSGDGGEMIALSDIESLFSRIIDFRSRFTATHSKGVAAVSEAIAQLMGLNGACRIVRAAGHLHDLGKLAVPKEILEAARPLTPEERELIRIHPYHTSQVLRTIDELHEVAMWSGFHHECLDGSGYPFHLQADDLTTEARILAVADLFSALSEDRPYRSAMPRGDVIRILDRMARDLKLDADIVALAITYYDELDARRRAVQIRIEAEYDIFTETMTSAVSH
ncbi:MAG: HD domain-containing protein [Deltaproteobacteria bacterium]|nr:HD domain-containing protein [Deltaproteobacteria bacterium]